MSLPSPLTPVVQQDPRFQPALRGALSNGLDTLAIRTAREKSLQSADFSLNAPVRESDRKEGTPAPRVQFGVQNPSAGRRARGLKNR
jgi:hypothetical protein